MNFLRHVYGLNLLLVLVLALRDFSPDSPGFLLPQEVEIPSRFQIATVCDVALLISFYTIRLSCENFHKVNYVVL